MHKLLFLILLGSTCFGQQSNRKLVWEENFNGKSLNDKNWNFELGDGCPNCGWGNNERQLYTDKNYKISHNELVITAQKVGDKYFSTKINTKGKKEFLYGRFEARAKLPKGRGIWPAFWMLGSNISEIAWPKCGEIDILEYVGREPQTVFTTLHTQDSHGNSINTKKTKLKNIEQGYHIYAIDWTKDKIDFLVDNQLVYSFNPANKTEDIWPFDKPFYFIVNVAVGGNFGGHEIDDSIFPQDFSVDYIRVYQ